jgi:hypothetical protein
MKRFMLTAIVAGTLSATAVAQDVRVALGDITDKRTTGKFFAECEVELRFTGDALADSFGIRAIRVKTATDDTGRDLKPKEKKGGSFFRANKSGDSTLEKKVTLRNPSRTAKTIKLLEGEAEVFSPTAANGGIVIIKDFMKQPGQLLAAPAMQPAGIKFTYVTKEVAAAMKKKQAEELKQTARKEAGEFGEAMVEAFGELFGSMGDSANSLQFFIDDPNDRLVEIEFQDSKGKVIKTHGRMSSDKMHSYNFSRLPGPDAQLIVYLATPAATKIVPFKLEAIPLP